MSPALPAAPTITVVASHHWLPHVQPDLIVHQINFLIVIELQIDGSRLYQTPGLTAPVLALSAISRYPGVT